MFIKNQKELSNYLKTKTDIFNQKKTTPIINKKLSKSLDKILKVNQIETFAHAKNTFFFDKQTQSFLLFEHLLITPKGILVLNFVEMPNHLEFETPLWWKSKKDGVLYPSPINQIKVMCERLSALILSECNEIIPVIPYFVSAKPMKDYEEVMTLKHLPSQISQATENLPFVLSEQKAKIIKDFLLNNQSETVTNKSHLYSPRYIHTLSSASNDVITDEFKQSVLYDLNVFLYEFAPESILYSDLKVSKEQEQGIEFLVISKKGLLLLTTLEGYARYEGKIDEPKWDKTTDTIGQDVVSEKIDNPTFVSISQLETLANCLDVETLPQTFRVVCQTPIQCKVRHKAIIDDKHIEHQLDRYFANTESLLEELEIQRIVAQLNALSSHLIQ